MKAENGGGESKAAVELGVTATDRINRMHRVEERGTAKHTKHTKGAPDVQGLESQRRGGVEGANGMNHG